MEHWVYELPLRLRSLFRRGRVERDLDEEIQYHLERKIEESVARGLTPAEARREALRAMDGLTQRKEECRDMRRVNFIDDILQDVRYGVRVLAKSPGFTAVAVVTLALAIGANAVVFGVLNAAILRSLNVPRAESLYTVQRGKDRLAQQSYPDYVDLRDRNRSFEGLAAFDITSAGLDTGNSPTIAWVYTATGNYFDVLGIQPHLGRFFHGTDEHGPNSAPYIVLSHGYWQTRFGGDPGAVGRTVQVNKHPFTIIGVAPKEFRGTLLFVAPDFYAPLVNQEQLDGTSSLGANVLNTRSTRSIFMTIGHLKAGVTEAQAVADLNSIGAHLERTYPKDDADMKFTLARPSLFGDTMGGTITAFVTALMALAGLVLLAACANLGSLFAARAADRAREVALRLALGASRNRILRQLFTEAALISLAGGALGLWGSVALLHRLSLWQPVPRFPTNVPVQPDANVYLVALALAMVSGLLFGLAPLRQVRRTDPYQTIKSGSIGGVGRRITMRDLLLGAQIAICAVLVTSSLVAARGMARSLQSDFGFEPRNALLLNTNMAMGDYREEAGAAMQQRIAEGVAALPGVTAVGYVDRLPLSGNYMTTSVYPDDAGEMTASNVAASPMVYGISPDYLRAAGTALLAGRSFTRQDGKGAPRVAVVNRAFAKKVFGTEGNTAGRHFKRRSGTRYEVVGLVEDGKHRSLTEDPQPVMYVPIAQTPASDTWLVARSERDAGQLAAEIRGVVRGLDAGLPFSIQTWREEMAIALFGSRVATVALGVLGAMGAMLAITGIFGMAAYSVSRRMRELGIRVALGAQRREVLQAALGRAFRLLAVGSAAGLGLGMALTRVLGSIVYQATPRDPVVLAGVVVAMLLLGLAATWVPAHRALSLDPMKLLREE
jgi:predicted permease